MKTETISNKRKIELTEEGLLELKKFINRAVFTTSGISKEKKGAMAIAFLSVLDNSKYPIDDPKLFAFKIKTDKNVLEEAIHMFENSLERLVKNEWYEEASIIKETIITLKEYNKNKN